MRHTLTETSQRYIDCLDLFLKHGGRNVSRIEREMRLLGHHDFSRRILYNRTENGLTRPGWIERYAWRELLDAGQTGGNVGRGECAPPRDRPRGTAPNNAARQTAPRLPHFRSWLKRVSPNLRWDLPHLEYLYTHLKKISDGSCKRLMIFMPPRHGKSETVTVRYTAWRLAQDPAMNVILGSYNQRLANRFSRKIRRVLADDASITLKEKRDAGDDPESVPPAVAGGDLQSPITRARHQSTNGRCPECHRSKERNKPDTFHTCTHTQNALPFAHRPANSEAEWETGQGGGLRAVGVGSGVTGFGASLIVIDDPVKSRAEAESETYRDKVWDWFNDDLYTRLEPNGGIILIQTRWHEDDLAGRLLKEMQEGGEHWDVVDLPAICEERPAADPARPASPGVGSPTVMEGAAERSSSSGYSGLRGRGS